MGKVKRSRKQITGGLHFAVVGKRRGAQFLQNYNRKGPPIMQKEF